MQWASSFRRIRSRFSRGAFLALLIGLSGHAGAAELLMFEQAGCPFCQNFDREIAPGYADSPYGRAAPLRRVDIHVDRRGGLAGVAPAVFTPTFVLVDDDGREVARLEGYPGRKWFYPELDLMMEALTGGAGAIAQGSAAESATVPNPLRPE
jgi:hypothetical protein